MISIPNKVTDRVVKELGRYQAILKSAKDSGVNESDIVTIIKDITNKKGRNKQEEFLNF